MVGCWMYFKGGIDRFPDGLKKRKKQKDDCKVFCLDNFKNQSDID